MTTSTSLELSGTFAEFPACELLLECSMNALSGSFRFAKDAYKIAVYFDRGAIVYAVSNLRIHRLPEIAVRLGVLQANDVTQFKSAWSELELGDQLIAAGKLTTGGLNALQTQQITEILRTALAWDEGEWSFSSLVRARDDLRFELNPATLFVESARKMSNEFIVARFKSNAETFAVQSDYTNEIPLMPIEGFVFSRFDGVLNLEELQTLAALPDAELRRAIYILWLGGFLHRYNWQRAFPEGRVAEIQSAKIMLARGAAPLPEKAAIPVRPLPPNVGEQPSSNNNAPESGTDKSNVEVRDEKHSVAEFLARADSARTHYELLGVDLKADEREIKQVYFALAKQFHPDKFHQSDERLQKRLQKAFAGVAQAFETLKNEKSRELYDFKIRKMLAANSDPEKISADDCFENGRRAIENKDFAEAVKSFARAVQLQPSVARFHAAYAQALAASAKYRHQAENEFMTAVRLEPDNVDFRLALAEFYRDQGLTKRAENEARRVLANNANNARAKQLLANLTANKPEG